MQFFLQMFHKTSQLEYVTDVFLNEPTYYFSTGFVNTDCALCRCYNKHQSSILKDVYSPGFLHKQDKER